jgi:hypothetical protein
MVVLTLLRSQLPPRRKLSGTARELLPFVVNPLSTKHFIHHGAGNELRPGRIHFLTTGGLVRGLGALSIAQGHVEGDLLGLPYSGL